MQAELLLPSDISRNRKNYRILFKDIVKLGLI